MMGSCVVSSTAGLIWYVKHNLNLDAGWILNCVYLFAASERCAAPGARTPSVLSQYVQMPEPNGNSVTSDGALHLKDSHMSTVPVPRIQHRPCHTGYTPVGLQCCSGCDSHLCCTAVTEPDTTN